MIGTVDENTVVDTMKPAAEQGRRVSPVKVYQAMLALSIVSNLIVGVIIFFWPDTFTSFAGQPEAFPKAQIQKSCASVDTVVFVSKIVVFCNKDHEFMTHSRIRVCFFVVARFLMALL